MTSPKISLPNADDDVYNYRVDDVGKDLQEASNMNSLVLNSLNVMSTSSFVTEFEFMTRQCRHRAVIHPPTAQLHLGTSSHNS